MNVLSDLAGYLGKEFECILLDFVFYGIECKVRNE